MTSPKRYDPYGPVHKGIRAAHMRCLVAIGSTDPNDESEIDRLAREITDHLTMCDTHLHDENSILHEALEKRRPGASVHAAEDHEDHECSFEELHALLSRLVSAAAEHRTSALEDLYRRFIRFVADDLTHMQHEEEVLLRDLQLAFTDDELQQLEGQIVASIAPDHMALFLDAMIEGLPKSESQAMLEGMKAGMPPEIYREIIDAVEGRRSNRHTLERAA